MMKKRGISAIVATVLIILITVSAITIIWVAIIPLISDQFGGLNPNSRVNVVTSEGYTFYDPVKNLVTVQVQRNAGTDEMKEIRITLYFNGTSYSSTVPAPAPNQLGTYTFNLSASDPPFPAPESVSVAPIFVVGDSKEEGVASSNVEMGPGNLRNVPGTLYELGNNYAPTTPAAVPDCTHPDQCTSPGYCQDSVGASCTAGSCIYAPDATKEGQPCDDGNSGTGPDTCSSGVCSGPTAPTGCTSNPDCDSPGSCQVVAGATCNIGTGVCTYPAAPNDCQAASIVNCGVAIASPSGCSSCTGTGTYCALGSTCTANTCVPDLSPCTDADTDNWCAEVSGTCDPSGGLCTGGYGDCNNGDGTQFKLYTSGPYYADSDLDTYGSNAASFASVCRGATLPSNIITTRQGDCNDGVGSINPGATEVCGDGIDNDCLGGDEACSSAPPTDYSHYWDFESYTSTGTVIFADQQGSTQMSAYSFGSRTFLSYGTCFKGSNCLELSHSYAYARTSTSVSTTPATKTFSFWFNPGSFASTTYPEKIYGVSWSYPMKLELENDVLWFRGGSDRSNARSASTSISTLSNKWNHVAFTWNGNVASLYLNGNFIATKPFYDISGSTLLHRIGYYDSWDNTYALSGHVDEIKQYERVLTFEEIQALYQDNS